MTIFQKTTLAADQAAVQPAYNLDFICSEIRHDWDRCRSDLCRRIEQIYGRSGITMTLDRHDQQYYLSALYTVVRMIRAGHIVETGTFVGCSALGMACAMEDYGLTGSIDTIDPAPRQYGISVVQNPVSYARKVFSNEFPDRIVYHRGYSVRPWDDSRHELPDAPSGILNRLARARRTDLLVIDGDHSYEGAYADLEVGYRGLRVDGPRLIFVHDYHSIPGVRRAIRDWRLRHHNRVAFRAWTERSGFALIQCHPAMLSGNSNRPVPARARRQTFIPFTPGIQWSPDTHDRTIHPRRSAAHPANHGAPQARD